LSQSLQFRSARKEPVMARMEQDHEPMVLEEYLKGVRKMLKQTKVLGESYGLTKPAEKLLKKLEVETKLRLEECA